MIRRGTGAESIPMVAIEAICSLDGGTACPLRAWLRGGIFLTFHLCLILVEYGMGGIYTGVIDVLDLNRGKAGQDGVKAVRQRVTKTRKAIKSPF